MASLLVAAVSQAEPILRSLQIGSQSPAVAAPGGLAYFPFSITRTGTGSLPVQMSVSGLPAGCTYSFVPPDLSFSDQAPSTKNAKVLIRVSASTAQGSYPFTLSAVRGNSANVVSVSATLVVGPAPVVVQHPVIYTPVRQPDGTVLLTGIGTAGQPLLIQATGDLSTGLWETIIIDTPLANGLFSLVDVDAPNYPARFYRAAQ